MKNGYSSATVLERFGSVYLSHSALHAGTAMSRALCVHGHVSTLQAAGIDQSQVLRTENPLL